MSAVKGGLGRTGAQLGDIHGTHILVDQLPGQDTASCPLPYASADTSSPPQLNNNHCRVGHIIKLFTSPEPGLLHSWRGKCGLTA